MTAMPEMPWRVAAIAIGSNVGDRLHWLNDALARVDAIAGFTVLETARVHESAGWGREDLKPFLNSAFAVAVPREMTPRRILQHLLDVETAMGRNRTLKWGPRTIDLDLLAIDDESATEPGLNLPHPWIARRPFVYTPLGEIAHWHRRWRELVVPHAEGIAIEADTVPLAGQPRPWGRRADVVTQLVCGTESEEESVALGRLIGSCLTGGETIFLEAAMGAGKTMLARGIARGLGIADRVQSPSFTLCREYATGRLPLEHWDFYRLESEEDLESTAWFGDRDDHPVRIVEWASRFPTAAHAPWLSVRIEIVGPEQRRITLASPDGVSPMPFALRVAMAESGTR